MELGNNHKNQTGIMCFLLGVTPEPRVKVCTHLRISLKAKLTCHLARCLLPVEIVKRCGLPTGPATAKPLTNLLPC